MRDRGNPFPSLCVFTNLKRIPKLNFREANINDLPQLLALEQSVIDAERPFDSSIKPDETHYYDLQHLISSDDALLVVAEDDGNIIGTGYAQIRDSKLAFIHEKHSYLGFMFVATSYRGKGINKTVIARLIEWSQSKGVGDLYLDVYTKNGPAIKAYEKMGFNPCLLEMKLSV